MTAGSLAKSATPDAASGAGPAIPASGDASPGDLQRQREADRALARAVSKMQEDERRRLSRELHDGIGQTLTAAVNQLQRLSEDAVASSNLGLAKRLSVALDLARVALQDTRELSRLLRPTLLDDLGLEAALGWLSRSFGERGCPRVHFDSQLGDRRLDAELETVVFRITQEALSNAVRHADARNIHVRLQCAREYLQLEVRDDGRGFDVAQLADPTFAAMHLGVRGMRDRARLFGANLALSSKPGSGTVLRVNLPLPGARQRRRAR